MGLRNFIKTLNQVVAPALVLCISGIALAETVTASFDYQLGDNDSRNDARNICYLNAQRKALERAGVYIESNTLVRDLRLERQDISAFTSAVAKVERIGDQVSDRGGAQVLNCSVRVSIDDKEVQKRMEQLRADSSMRSDLRRQHERIAELENRLEELTRNLGKASNEQALSIRLERSAVVADIRSIEAATRSWEDRTERNKKLQMFIREKVKFGMTREEIIAILGPPTQREKSGKMPAGWKGWEKFTYGDSQKSAVISFDAKGFVNMIEIPMIQKGPIFEK
ncbi:MAG: hypothetical protein HGB21_03555 [Nitrospirae bacterium]|nr:hypothetical protein [Nitrospirota bacterium]NTW65380.1 hypothetical protein [Nitrospirota bacterium]